MMFPRFDKLAKSPISELTSLLQAVGFEDPAAAVAQLKRIQHAWLLEKSRRAMGDQDTVEPTEPERARFNLTPSPRQGSHTVDSPDIRTIPGDELAIDPRLLEPLLNDQPAWYNGLQRVLKEAPLRDTVLNVFEQYVRNAREHFDPFLLFENTPRSLDILARIACGSPFLTQTLLADPACLTTLTTRGRTAEVKSREQFVSEAQSSLLMSPGRVAKLSELRRFQRRELLRIGMCDAFGLLDLRFVTLQLSLLADAMVQVSLNLAAEEIKIASDSIAVIALGKHGGEELNYSSDIDLILIAATESSEIQRLARLTIDGLAENVSPGFLYRVDLRLRPWGDAGPLVSTLDAYARYMQNDAELWEKQALLKARVVAGSADLGRQFLAGIRPFLFTESANNIRTSIQLMKERIEARLRQRGKLDSEVKLGVGSIRDIEFLVQFLQLTHGGREPRILSFNTLDSLVRLAEFGLVSAQWYRQLRAGYVFLRTVEHSLQLLHNQQTHELPADARQRDWLANRLDYPGAETLLARFAEHRTSVRAIFDACLRTSESSDPVTSGHLRQIPLEQTSRREQDAQTGAPESLQAPLTSTQVQVIRHLSELVRNGETVAVDSRAAEIAQSSFEAPSVAQWPFTSTRPTVPQPITAASAQMLTFCGNEFTGWLSIITGLLSIHQMNIVRGTALLAYPDCEHDIGCTAGQYVAVFTVIGGAVTRGSENADAAGSATDKYRTSSASSDSLASSRLRDELTEYVQQIQKGNLEAVREDLISRFCATMHHVADPMLAETRTAETRAPGGAGSQGAAAWSIQRPETTHSHTSHSHTSLTPMQIEVNQDVTRAETSLHISGIDTPGFLFELSHALSISQFRIIRANVDSVGDQVRDVLFVTERDGRPIVCEARVQELRVTVALIKQFTHWLPSTSNPHQALVRFRQLLARLQPASHWNRDVQSLQKPDVLHAVARVLGISQFLWEDFLRSRYEELFPLLANTSELQERLERPQLTELLEHSIGAAIAKTPGTQAAPAAWSALNAFKDRHLFRIDMRHVLGYCRPFGAFSEEITELAEIVVAKAMQIAAEQLQKEHGRPWVNLRPQTAANNDWKERRQLSTASPASSGARTVDGTADQNVARACVHVVAGLGKCGGIEMGYASDIELMLVYEDDGTTDGAVAISNARYFEMLVSAVAAGISARQDGIFHVDLRMRPFGQAGSAAVSLKDFQKYYSVDGPSWPFERQALVKFRCLGGDVEFQKTVTAACHQAVYAAGVFEFAAMRAMRERQIRQLVRGGTINAKLSDGGLVDLEYGVQALQMTFGNRIPALRHSNTLTALRRAARMGLIDPQQRDQIEDAYVFLRELIDCLRMVRGNAKDLTIPEPGSSDYQQLARRMDSIHDSQISLSQLESQMQVVREFSRTVEQHCRAMRIHRGDK